MAETEVCLILIFQNQIRRDLLDVILSEKCLGGFLFLGAEL